MSTQPYDESKHPRATDGKFATKPATESDANLAAVAPPGPDLGAIHADRARALAADVDMVESALAKLRTEQTRHEVAAFVAKLPPDAHEIAVLDWSDDVVNDYGSYDLTLGEVTDADGNEIGHREDLTIPMRGDGTSPTDWAEAFDEEDYPPASIKVAAVREWAEQNLHPVGMQGAWGVVDHIEKAKERQYAEEFRDVVHSEFPTADVLEFARDHDEFGERVDLAEIRDAEGNVIYERWTDGDGSMDTYVANMIPRFGELPAGLQPEGAGDDFVEVRVSQLDDLDTFLGR